MERETKTATAAKERRESTRLSSVANSIRLLKAFSVDEPEMGVTHLSRRLGLAKSTVHRLASALIGEGMLEQDSRTGRYRLGTVLVELSARVRRAI